MKTTLVPRIEQLSACPICHSKKIRFWSEGQDLLTQSSDQIFSYSKCLDCDCLFMSTRPIEEDVSFFYSSEYHPYQSELIPSISKEVRISNDRLIKLKKYIFHQLRQFKKSSKSVFGENLLAKTTINFYKKTDAQQVFVDFGCGAGKTLNHMCLSGWETIGVDFSPFAIESVIGNNHKGYLVDDFWRVCKDNSVDLIRMNHVIEHLYYPQDLISQLASKIKSNGRLHIAVPNPSGLSAILFGKNWWGLECPRHVILYPPQTLINLLQEAGFYNYVIIQESVSKDLIRSMGYFLANLGLIELTKVNDLMYSNILKIACWLPSKVATYLGKGDRFHIFCLKQ